MFDDHADDELPARHEIPSQFRAVDKLRFGPVQISFRQAGCLLLALAWGYVALTEWPFALLPLGLRLPLALALLPVAALFAWRRPGGRPFEQWLLVALRFAVIPRHAVWRPREPRPDDWRAPVGGSWAAASPRFRAAAGDGEGRGR